jgi:signal recognition particle subunit SRP54
MFERLSERFREVFKRLGKKGKLTQEDVKEALRDIKRVLLEADVNYLAVKKFIEDLGKRAVGEEVLDSLTPNQQIIKLVHEELIRLMGSTSSDLRLDSSNPSAMMLVGLHGSGKTTCAGKLAYRFKNEGKKVLLVSADPYRPAAKEQLKLISKEVGVNYYAEGENPIDTAKFSVGEAKKLGCDIVILDTAGRFHVDTELMNELIEIKKELNPSETLLVVDAMTGQEAVKLASTFNEELGVDGFILTKLDGDARGGAALSIRMITGKPIKFVGTGERLNNLEIFYPDRMASRILGMGDLLTLIEKAEKIVDEKKAEEIQKKFRKKTFNLNDFLEQMRQIRKMGPLDQLLEMIPGFGKPELLAHLRNSEKELSRIEGIINSMTLEERLKPEIINGSRRRRIAAGSGTTVTEVNKLLKQFEKMKTFLYEFEKKKPKFGLPFPFH